MFKKFLYKAFVLSSCMIMLGVSTNASATPIATSATVVGVITVTQGTALNFGQFSVGGTGGTVVFPAGGVVSTTGDVVHLASEVGGVALLNTTGVNPVGATVTVTVVTTTPLTFGLNTMAVVPNCLGPGGVLGSPCTFNSSQAAAEQVRIGGTVTVSPAQIIGTYNGTIEVTAAF